MTKQEKQELVKKFRSGLKKIIDDNKDRNDKMVKDLGKITAKVFIIACYQDPHFPPELDGIPMSEMIQNSQLVIMDSSLGHLCFNELENITGELNNFMKDFEVKNDC